MKFTEHVFREYDIRGLADKELTEAFAHHLGFAYRKIFERSFPLDFDNPPTIAIGQDCRLSSPRLAASLKSSLLAQGFNVVDLGIVPTPITYFSIYHLNLQGGIMVTGSHNPSEFNGFKICVGKNTIHGSDIQLIKQYFSQSYERGVSKGSESKADVFPDYISFIKKSFPSIQSKKVVLDAGNGTAAILAPKVFRALGCEVVELFCTYDGRFPNHHPDPTVPKNLQTLISKVQETKADFGVGYDGDTDRIGLVDNLGRIIFGDEMMVLFSRQVLKERPGATIIAEVKSSYRLFDDIKKNGGKGIIWKTGHSLIKAKMKEESAALAGEMSGHIFFNDRFFGFDDAIYASVRILEILSQEKKPLSDLLVDLPKSYFTPEIRIDCEERLKFDLVKMTQDALSRTPKATLNLIDGIRADFNDGWGLLRASNTQPVIVLRFEANTPDRLEQIRTIFYTALLDSAARLGHPALNLNDQH